MVLHMQSRREASDKRWRARPGRATAAAKAKAAADEDMARRNAIGGEAKALFFALLGVMACACRLEWEWKHSSSSDAERHRTNQLHVMAHILEPIRGLPAHRLASGVWMILVTSTSSSVGFVVAVRACVRGRRRRSPQVCRVQTSPAAAGAHSHHHMHRG